MSVIAIETFEMQPGESKLLALDFTPLLKSSETLSGTPTVTATPGTDVTISAIAVNTSAIDKLDGTTIAVGKGVQFRAAIGGSATEQTHVLEISAASSLSNTHVGDANLEIND